MSTAENSDAQPADDEIAAKLREATELLESVAHDRGLLGALTVEERTRLLTAAADVFNPDVVQRRRFTKAKRKEERDASIRADESMLADTGIRVLRDRPVFTTPNVYPPKGFEPGGGRRRARVARDASRSSTATSASSPTASSTRSTTSSARRARDFNFAQALRDRRPRAAASRCSPAGA